METQQSTIKRGGVGSDDFKKLVIKNSYVDKSLFVKDVIDDANDVILITRPRRWGKSSNMSLLKTFLELEIDKEGNPLPDAKKANPVYFTGGIIEEDGIKQTLSPLKIINKEYYSAKKDYEEYRITMNKLGKYPVIMLSFKDIVCSSYETIQAGIQDVLALVFEQHKYLMFSDHLDANAKDRLSCYLKGELDLAHIQRIIKDLLSFLYHHFNQKVWVLIDEYDSAIHRAYVKFGKEKENPYEFSKDFDNVLELFRNIMGPALKSDIHLEKGVVTGILRIAKANLFSTLNNFTEYNVLDKKYASYYGFTEAEVDMLCSEQNISTDKRVEIKQWYNGYNYGGLELYNPWSMARCLFNEEQEIKNYWEESGGFGFLTNIMIEDEVQAAIQDFVKRRDYKENVFVEENIDLASLLDADKTTVVSLLLHSGYLNPKSNIRTEDGIICTLGIPNQEVVSAFKTLIRKWTAKKLGVQPSMIGEIALPLLMGDVSLFKERLQNFLGKHFSFRIIKGRKNHLKEGYYHCLMIGVLYGMQIKQEVSHEKESGEGYVDTVIVPRLYQGQQALILEYKYAKTEKSLQTEAEAALQQIKEKNYIATVVGEKHIKSVLQLGIAFHQKEVEVVHEIVDINA